MGPTLFVAIVHRGFTNRNAFPILIPVSRVRALLMCNMERVNVSNINNLNGGLLLLWQEYLTEASHTSTLVLWATSTTARQP